MMNQLPEKISRLGLKLLTPFLLMALVFLVGVSVTAYAGFNAPAWLAGFIIPGLLILLGLIGLTFVLTGFYVVKNVIRPIETLKAGVIQLSQGRFDQPIQISTGDELEQLAHEFNAMAVALQTAQQTITLSAEEKYKQTDQQLQQRVKELSGLQKVSRELNSTLVLDNIIRLVIAEAVRATDADFGDILLCDPDTSAVTTHLHLSQSEDAPEKPATLTVPAMVSRVIQRNEPEIIAGAPRDSDFAPYPTPVTSQMIVPIQQGDVAGGVINLESKKSNAFTPLQLQYVQALADQAAIAIRNAREYENQIKERREASLRVNQLAKLSEISRAFRANHPLEYILEDIAFAVQETAGFDVVLLSVVKHNALHRVTAAGIPVAEMEQLLQITQPVNVVQSVMREEFKLSDSYFIPAHRREVWEGKLHVTFEPITGVSAAPAGDDQTWQLEDLLFTPLTDAEGKLIGLLSVDTPRNGRRPTQRVITTLELFAHQAATAIENANLFQMLERQTTHLRLSGQISARISGILNPGELMEEVVNLIAGAFTYYHVQIYQVKEAQPDQLELRECAGTAVIDAKKLDPKPELSINAASVIGWVAQQKQALLLNDVSQDARYQYVSYLPETQSEMAVPIVAGQTLLGVLDVQHHQRNAFTPEALDNLQILADQLSIAMQNAQLFDEALQRERLSSALGNSGLTLNATLNPDTILDVICREAVLTFKVDSAFLWLVEADQVRGVAAAGQNKDKFIGQTASLADTQVLGVRVIQQKHAEYRNNVDFSGNRINKLLADEPVCSAIMAPLMVRDKTLGAIVLVDAHNPRRFDVQDRISVTQLSNQAAIAIENARLVDRLNKFAEELETRVDSRTEELRQERDRVDALYKIARELSSSLDLDRVLNEALALLDQTIKVTRGAILLADEVSGNLIYRAAIHRRPVLPKGGLPTQYRLGVGFAGMVLENRRPVIVPNLQEEESWIPDGKPLMYQSAMGVPLVTGYETVGVLLLYHSAENYFTEDHLRLVTAAAPIIATAINNAGLYNLISEQVERLGSLLNSVRAEANKNQAIIEGIADGVLVLDEDYNIQLINPVATNLLGFEPGLPSERHLDRLVTAPPKTGEQQLASHLYRYINAHWEGPNGAKPEPYQIEINKKVVLVILSSVSISPGAPASRLVVLRDISREAELDQMKNEFISTVSHELRTPMTSIKGYTDLLVSNKVGPLTDMQRKFVQVIKNNADRLTALVNDILDISRIDTGRVRLELSDVDMKPIIEDVIISLSHQMEEKRLTVTTDIPARLPLVYVDPARATQIMVNLVGNAVKYTRPGDSIFIRVRALAKKLQIDVSDTGLGIAEDDIDRVFNRFFRADRDISSAVDGTGLGLAITKMFIEMMGGEIWVESKVDVGSTFSFTLPYEDQQIEETAVADTVASRKRVLVIDDNTDILTLLKEQLEVEGYRVFTASTGAQAIELAKKHQPALITLDIMLDDMDGFAVLETLKNDPETAAIPVVVASVLNDVRQRGMALGAADYIIKPFDKDTVVETVHRLISALDQNNGSPMNKILIVDDDKDLVNWLKKSLVDNGFVVQGAYNGQEALLLARESHPDLILLDLMMPGMDGYEVISKLKEVELTATIPVIVITGHSVDKKNDTIKMVGLGAKNLLTKPFSVEELVSEIKRLEQPAATPADVSI